MDRRIGTTAFLCAIMLASQVPAVYAQQDEPVALPGSDIIGDEELPIGLDIVPWRQASPGEVSEGPTQILSEQLSPIDPTAFRRETEIYKINH